MQHTLLILALLVQALFAHALPAAAQSTPPDTSDLTIEALRKRSYGAGSLRIERTLADNAAFTRALISYDSDGQTVYGFVNTPKGAGPFPVVLMLHGYVTPSRYRTPLGYTTRYADALARQGFLVIHPDYRAHGRSTGAENSRENLFRVGYAVDVLNLIALAKTIPQADATRVGLMGHSMGGGIALRVMAVNRAVKAGVLYGAMNADEFKNVDQIRDVFRRARNIPEDAVPDERYAAISPSSYLADIDAAISIQHGERDAQVPVQWGRDLHRDLSALNKDVAIDVYTGQGHSLQGRPLTQMLERVTAFFKRTL
jgi:uncharacterized protein